MEKLRARLRPMEYADIPAVTDIAIHTWFRPEHFDGDEHASATIARYFVLDHARRVTWAHVAEVQGTVQGVILTNTRGAEPLFPQAVSDFAAITALLESSAEGRAGLDEFAEYTEAKLEMEREAAAQCEAEWQLFMVDPAAKGRGVGGQLWAAMLDHYRQMGVHSYYLYTDTGCDWQLYEAKGLERVAEQASPAEPVETATPSEPPAQPDAHGGEPYSRFVYVGRVE